ncbi:Flavodoxin-like fold [Desulfobaculum bizertense DSM 18034]|uniref:Flavodoxin-like fold n=2 Tax=Desulfobaculum TaxID=1433996 RepID=A0A1T4WLF3_9BACT|nr:Flavodoxin-like fold [Desulfobaculum bizertense DSM 18034]
MTDTSESLRQSAIFSCSPSAHGCCDIAADNFAQGVQAAGGALRGDFLRRYKIEPCQGCYRCKHDRNRACYLTKIDHSDSLFQRLYDAPFAFFSAPIYFYHVPAHFKAWIDRSQCYFLRKEDGDETLNALPRRKAYVSLCAGRKDGEKLFEGTLLTLKYFLRIFNFELQEPYLYRGSDAGDPELADTIRQEMQALGERAWQESL